MQTSPWPEQYRKTRREIVADAVSRFSWNLFFLQAICGSELDWGVPNREKILLPDDLLAFLRSAKVAGMPLITEDGKELLAAAPLPAAPLVTPLAVAGLLLAVAVVNLFLKWRGIDWLFLAIQSLAGLFFTYLVFFSRLPATSWNWLLIPFNLLPLVFWKWRGKWALVFAGTLVLWEAGMILSPHRLTDPAYLVLVTAYIVLYARLGWRRRTQDVESTSERKESASDLKRETK